MPAPLHPSTALASADFDSFMTFAVRDLTGDRGYQETLERVVGLAAEMVPGCSAAGVSVPTKDVLTTLASTNPGVKVAHTMQLDLGEGPTLDAMARHGSFSSSDLAHDSRWPHWGPRASQQLGITGVLSAPLYTSTTNLGVLTLYGVTPVVITSAHVRRVEALTAVAAAAIAAASTAEHLLRANQSRLTIGQAQGILMKQFDLDADRAFAVMNRISQDTNTKLIAVAERVVTTRSLP